MVIMKICYIFATKLVMCQPKRIEIINKTTINPIT